MSTKHGHGRKGNRTPTYRSWECMISRCYNQRNVKYPIYGARGIEVCERWRSTYVEFLRDMGEKPAGYTLDRIDSDGNYEPGNCRWSDSVTQNTNRRGVTLYEWQGGHYALPALCRLLAINLNTARTRLRRGLPIEEVIRLGQQQNGDKHVSVGAA
jgi:hypothetical protein